MSAKTFLFYAFKNQKITGSILPSQRILIKRMVDKIPKKCKCVIEFGAGTGSITKCLSEKLPKECILISFEINPDLSKYISIKKENFILINDDAQNLSNYLKKYKIKSIDGIVSSIPFGNLGKEKTLDFLNNSKNYIKKNGFFIQYQYFLTKLHLMKKVFNKINVSFVPWNIPPAFIYSCKK